MAFLWFIYPLSSKEIPAPAAIDPPRCISYTYLPTVHKTRGDCAMFIYNITIQHKQNKMENEKMNILNINPIKVN